VAPEGEAGAPSFRERLSAEVMAEEEAPSSGWGASEDGAEVGERIKFGPLRSACGEKRWRRDILLSPTS